nr:acyl-CoA dehydrogenase family protein [Clostridia bacterium]
DVRIPATNLIGAEGEGFKILMRTLDRSRIMVGAQCLGIAQGAFDEAVKYARTREQFGQSISKFQGVQFLLAEMKTLVEASRHLVYDAANRWDHKVEPITQYSSIAKLFCSEACVKVTDKAVQVLGGYGYIRDYHVERMLRDAKHATLVEGTTQIQKLIIAREILGRDYV